MDTSSTVKLSSPRGRWVLVATVLASGMAFLDGSIVTVAVPRLQEALGLNLAGIQWVVNGYLLSLSALIITAGALGDRYGHRRVFLNGIALFTAGSVACGLAPTGTLLIIARVVQGIGAALMVPGSLTILRTTFPKNEVGTAIGYWAGLSGGIAALGPLLGGVLVQQFDWPWIFFINVPLGLLAYLLTVRAIPADRSAAQTPIDWWGTVAIAVALTGLSAGLMSGQGNGWVASSWLLVLIGGAGLVGFALVEQRVKHPMVPLAIFSDRTVLGANVATLCIYGALNAVIFFLALNLQQLQGYRPDQAGLALLPPILLITVLAGPFGGFSNRFGLRKPLLAGSLIVGTGMALLARSGIHGTYLTSFFPGLVLFGLGMSLVISPITQAALAVPMELTGAASGVNNAVARVAGLLAIAILGAVALSAFTQNLTHERTDPPLSIAERVALVREAPKFGEATVPELITDPAARTATQTVIDRALHQSLSLTMALSSASVFLAAIVIAVTIPGKQDD